MHNLKSRFICSRESVSNFSIGSVQTKFEIEYHAKILQNKFHIHQCQAQNTLRFETHLTVMSPELHLTNWPSSDLHLTLTRSSSPVIDFKLHLTFTKCSRDIHLMFIWHSPDVHMTFTWFSHDIHLMFTWHSTDVHLMFIWCPDHHLTFPWPFPNLKFKFKSVHSSNKFTGGGGGGGPIHYRPYLRVISEV